MDHQRRPTLLQLATHLEAQGAQVVGDGHVELGHSTEDSRKVEEGSLFVARMGEKVDGRKYAAAALKSGAAAVLCEKGSGVEVEPRLEVSDIRAAWGKAAHFLWRQPSRSLSLVGITGTNGKTTCCSLLAQALAHLGCRTARLGTLGFFIGDELVEGSLTTPQPDALARALAACRDHQVDFCVMEVSSHALEQQRVAGISFDVAALTNLSQDHLDFHGTMEAYREAKARLFRDYEVRAIVLNADDAFGRDLFAERPGSFRVSSAGEQAELGISEVSLSAHGIEARAQLGDESGVVRSPLLGAYNVSNISVVLGILVQLEYPLQDAIAALAHVSGVPGRLERCEGPDDDITVLVDYAHTPDALAKALDAVCALAPTQVVCLFGCGGDRDRRKRPLMAEAVALRADRVWLTSDNPRTEDPLQILADARAGLQKAAVRVSEEPDRARAIELAVMEAPPGSIVLLAGKGHETYQLVGNEVRDFDDRVHARQALEKRRQQRQ